MPCLQVYHHLPLLYSLLGRTLAVLKTHASKGVIDQIVSRASRLYNLEKYDRLINDFNTDFVVCFPLLFDYSELIPALD
jgi:hypothetical protein